MPTMDKQQVLEAVEKAITEGGNIVIRFGWGQMRTLRQEEAELLLAALKPSQSYVPSGWKLVPIVPTEEMVDAGAETPGMQYINGVLSMHQLRGGIQSIPELECESRSTSAIGKCYTAMVNAALDISSSESK